MIKMANQILLNSVKKNTFSNFNERPRGKILLIKIFLSEKSFGASR